ncbi:MULTISPECIES: AI-2E family transporter [unclassified Lentimicrobium]|uniref:AI-2E family transporter n=1 Tax=unclassified Lentimicrobium TaxID=2677434 RepID=UPI0015568B27|nr:MULTISPECIES: AI-2E family transporter [unclassified Lentimicrobium]NPD47547.1 AI-2E family transporter [Lentimicrobium sp. S6]NPD86362.1 AI-2E family transporter [Lentimicrobium sp. L6]
MQKQTKSIPNIVLFAAFIIVVGGMIYAESIITQFLMAFFVSIVFAQPIIWLKRKKVPQSLAIPMVFLLIIVVFVGFGELISNSLSSFSKNAPLYEQNLTEMGVAVMEFMKGYGVNLSMGKLTNIFDPSKVMNLTAGFLGQLGGFMGNAFTIVFLVLFLLFELDSFSIKSKAIAINTNVSISYFNTIGNSIRNYLSIKTITSLLTGAMVWISLAILGLDYAIIWALIAFLLNYIPNIGSIIAAVPAVLFALIQLGFIGGIWTSVIFVAANTIVGNVVEPKMMGKGMGLSTFIVFASLLFWGFIFGTVGMFLSVPLTMTIKIMMEQSSRTKWIAVILGTEEDAKQVIEGGQAGEES